MRRHRLTGNDNRGRFVNLCLFNKMVTSDNIFSHKYLNKATSVSLDYTKREPHRAINDNFQQQVTNLEGSTHRIDNHSGGQHGSDPSRTNFNMSGSPVPQQASS
ncbi:unnamed protein product [Schistosoma mattheei]|uniref:Uncharacterized protein n=1 Tax=Schistosoma mattheei TaxID=31246 RepID=A0A183PCA3_9TREM|nr:unnamed protein product [Schistosoma mattheei]